VIEKRILMISNFFPPDAVGGAERVLFNTAKSLAERGYALRVLARQCHETEEDTNIEFEVHRRLRFHGAHPQNLAGRIRHLLFEEYFDSENAKIVREEIKDFKPDLLYLNALTGLSHSPLWTAAQSGIPLIIHLHDYWLRDALSHKKLGWLNKILFSMLKNYLIVTVSEAVRRLVINSGVAPEKVVTVLNALSEDFPVLDENEINMRRGAVYCGRISRAKGLHIIASTGTDVDVYGNGDKEYLEECIKKSESRIHYKGCISHSEVTDVFRRYAISILPSLWMESCPLVLLESMASGCVPIASDIGGIPEVLGRGEDSAGLLIPPGDAQALEEAGKFLLDNDSVRLDYAKRGIQRVKRLFNWQNYVDRIEKNINEMILDQTE